MDPPMNSRSTPHPFTLRTVVAVTLALIAVFATPARAAPPSRDIALQSPELRSRIELSGAWQVIVDPQSVGDRSPLPGVDGWAYWRARPFTPSLILQEYQFSPKHTLRVPGDWQSQRADLARYEGPIWYRRTFSFARRADERLILSFGAANYRANVYLNGKAVGAHEGGFTPFAFDVTDLVVDGENNLVVKVDARLSATTIPTASIDWENYAGLTRDVVLVRTPSTFIRDWEVRLLDHTTRKTRLRAWIADANGPVANKAVRFRLAELGLDATALTDATGLAEAQVVAATASLWKPGRPRLYTATISSGRDTITDRIGLRTVTVSGASVLLNGDPIFLKGVSAHEVSPRRPGRARGAEDAAALMRQLKDLNANFVRLAHYPHDVWTSRAADEAGLLVWAEIPVYWGLAFDSPAVLTAARTQLSAMLTRDRNRASVIVWSVANETPATEPRTRFLTSLIEDVRARDDGRLVTAALLPRREDLTIPLLRAVAARIVADDQIDMAQRATARAWLEKDQGRILDTTDLAALSVMPPVLVDDPLAPSLDVVAANQYFGWYNAPLIARLSPIDETIAARKVLEIMPSIRIDPKAAKPFIVSEFGAEAKAGFIGGPEQMWSETHQARVYVAQFDLLANSQNLVGMAPWVLQDFASPLRPLYDYQDGFNRKGLISETGKRKRAFFLLQTLYRSDAPFEKAARAPKANSAGGSS
jgi:beta-glucuronidase